jgi:uncharacterized protein DUF3305
MSKPALSVAVVMQRRASQSRWIDHVWEPVGVLSGNEGEAAPRVLVDRPDVKQWLHPGFKLVLHRDELEGYYLNVSASEPRVFVLWRMEGENGLPLDVTASSEEGGRWLDGGHSVDGVAMPPEIFAWVGEYVENNYRPEPKKRIKPRSFIHPKDRR